jgi:hypothetical protein
MKSATRHMLLLAGMLCLWASAYSLGRNNAHERAAPHERNPVAADATAHLTPRGSGPDASPSGIAVSGVGMAYGARTEAPAQTSAPGNRARAHGVQAPARSRAGSG